jgi:hypothetical protein
MHGHLAHPVERAPEKREVAGSIPAMTTTKQMRRLQLLRLISR